MRFKLITKILEIFILSLNYFFLQIKGFEPLYSIWKIENLTINLYLYIKIKILIIGFEPIKINSKFIMFTYYIISIITIKTLNYLF
jgi:hypothetical protein